MNAIIFKKFCEITSKTETPDKENYVFPSMGLSAKEIFEYFSKTNIQRTRGMVEIKCFIIKEICKNNKKFNQNHRYFFSFSEIAKMLFLKSHATVIHHNNREFFNDELNKIVRDSYILWIKKSIYPFAYSDSHLLVNNYLLINEDELPELEMKGKSIKISCVHRLMLEKGKTPLLEG